MKKIRVIWICMIIVCLSACTAKKIEEDVTKGKEEVTSKVEVDTTIKETGHVAEIITETQNTRSTETVTEGGSQTKQTESQEAKENNTEDFGRKKAYREILENIYYHYTFPDGNEYGFNELQNITDNRFAIFDIDSDGKEELIIEYTTPMFTAGMVEMIYDYRPENNNMVREELVEYPMLKFYKNGVIEAQWSHNHSMAEKLWPYTLYQYNKETDSYLFVAMVEAWEKSISDTREGIAFPDQADIDGDGIVYYIKIEGDYSFDNPVDFAEYKQWRESYIGDGTEIQVPFLNLTEENIHNIK